MRSYLVIDSLRHDRKRYACGESVELNDACAERLLAAGVVAVPNDPLTESVKPDPVGGLVPPTGEGDADPGDAHVESEAGAAPAAQADVAVEAVAPAAPASPDKVVALKRKKK